MKPVTTEVFARGHENIQATHKTTFEITKESTITTRGNCIMALEATKSASELSREFKEAARKRGAEITITIEAGKLRETVEAKGSPMLLFTHPTDLVIRKSEYVCDRTVAIRADKAANDFSRAIVEKIRHSTQVIRITLAVKS
jgi:hypothetical protein